MAQVDYFLKVDGIDGESTDSKHAGEIELESWSWGESNMGSSSSGGGAGSGKVVINDFHFVMKMNKASTNLMVACASGKHIKKAILTTRKAGGNQEDFFVATMSDVLVSTYQTGGSAHGEIVPVDQVSLNFSKIEFAYKPQKEDGSLGGEVKGGWDQKLNKPV
jgi:type VI secretion system secreted protein Hcp